MEQPPNRRDVFPNQNNREDRLEQQMSSSTRNSYIEDGQSSNRNGRNYNFRNRPHVERKQNEHANFNQSNGRQQSGYSGNRGYMNRNFNDKQKELPPRFSRMQNDSQSSRPEQPMNNYRNRNSNNTNSETEHFERPFRQMNLQSRSQNMRPNAVNAEMLDRPVLQNRRNNNLNNSNGRHVEQQQNHADSEKRDNKDKVNASQREIMSELLSKAKYECIVCCEAIKFSHKTFSCKNCYNVFHLKCVQAWARQSNVTESSAATNATNSNNFDSSNGLQFPAHSATQNRRNNRQANNSDWRCPTCQCVQKKYPFAYYCFCGKMKDPEISHSWHLPHSCGDTCSRPLAIFNDKGENEVDTFPCPHKCTLKCHPGKRLHLIKAYTD